MRYSAPKVFSSGVLFALALSIPLGGCAAEDDLDWSGTIEPVPLGSAKDDGPGQPAISATEDGGDTQAWKVRHLWEERDENPEARAAGIAWPANSHLNWDEKYAAWVQSMEKTPFHSDADRMSFTIVTPFGKTLPAPALECAEVAMFLRVTFASWYGLPFFMEARDPKAGRVFFGHFGIRSAAGRWGNTPSFAKFADYTGSWNPGQPWPKDAKLRAQKLGGNAADASADDQPMIGPDAHIGAYMDELHLNKRAGYLAMFILDFFYSGSLADQVNTYNLKPEALRAGDVLIRRWQKNGIGHVIPIKRITQLEGKPMAEVAYGGMPRHQPEWGDEVEGKSVLTGSDTGGSETFGDPPTPYWKLGGGLKRWRVARNIGGYWVNTFMPEDKQYWINGSDGEALGARPKQFETILGEVPAEQKRDSLLKSIESSRKNLMENPSSCSSRADRDKAMSKLLGLAGKLGLQSEELSKQYRIFDDFVFKPLYYSSSKTCCWNKSSKSMYRIVMDYAAEEQEKAKACVEPTLFRAEKDVPAGYAGPRDGYQRWRHWAAQKGRSAEWIDVEGQPAKWSEDELCEQRAVEEDTVQSVLWQSMCPAPPAPPQDPAPPEEKAPDAGPPGDNPDMSPPPSGSQ